MFSNEHMNYLITYSFDFQNEELLSYYISFLRFVFGFFVVLMIIDDHPIYKFSATSTFSDMFGCYVCVVWAVKSNKWKARQEYNFFACKDSQCK